MRIYLIGMPCCGKTTIGKELANKLNYNFIDLDAFIEKKALYFIEEIFEIFGEKTFRKLEAEALEETLKENNVVISTGGGVVLNKKNKNNMDGLIIYLETDLKILEERRQNDFKERPLLKINSLEKLFYERKKIYLEFQDIIIKNNLSIDLTVNEIIEKLKEQK